MESAGKRIEKERNEKYQKLKGDAKDARAKYREKYKLDNSPDPSDAEEESDDDEDDGFGTRKKEEDQDPAAKAKAMAEKAMKDPMSLVNNVGALNLYRDRLGALGRPEPRLRGRGWRLPRTTAWC